MSRIGSFRGVPQFLRDRERINLAFLPPTPLIPGRMIFAVVDGTQRHGKLVAHLERYPSQLSIANMMGVSRRAPADDARLLGHKAEVLFRTNPLYFPEGQCAFVDFLS